MTIGEIQALSFTSPNSRQEGPQPSTQERVAKNQEILQAIRTIDEAGGVGLNSKLNLTIDRTTGQPLIKVVNRVTNEVISQVPPETILRAAEVLRQLQNGERIA